MEGEGGEGGVRGPVTVRVGTGAKRDNDRMGGLRGHRQKGPGRTGSVEEWTNLGVRTRDKSDGGRLWQSDF